MTNEQLIQAVFTLSPEQREAFEKIIEGRRMEDMRIISIEDAGRELGLPTYTIRRMVDRGELENAPTTGGRRRVTMRSVTAYFNNIAGKPHNTKPAPKSAKRKNKKCKK